jgi:hypothetical protein
MTADAVTRAYNQAVRHGLGIDDVVRTVERSDWLYHGDHHCRLSRPLFVEEAEIRGFTEDMIGCLRLLASLPERVFDGDLARMLEVLRVDPERGALMTRLGGTTTQLVGRADVHRTEAGFRMLEFGIGSELGGWGFGGEVPKALLRSEPFAAFAARHGMDYVDTGQELVDALRDAAAAAGLGRDPVVGLVEAPGALARWGNTWRLHQEAMQQLGLDFRVGDLMDVSDRDGAVRLDGVRLDVVYRCFEAGDLVGDPEAVARAELLASAHEDSRIVLWTPMDANLLGEKGCLALLSDPRWGSAFTPAERALVDRVVPWTRSLEPGLVDECLARREELILKPNSMYGGIGVVAGWETPAPAWADAVRTAVRDGAVVQQRAVPRPDVVVDRDTGEEQDFRTLWGIFYTPRGYAGARCWMVPVTGRAVIGLEYGKELLAAGVFHSGGQPEAAEPDVMLVSESR